MNIQRWTRRRFLQSAALAGVAPLALQRSLAGEADWSRDFARALEDNPALLGWRSVQSDRLACTARIEGRLPEELRGMFYRNGPAVHERFGLRYRHMFDGDGMVQALRFDGHGVTHRARVLDTPKLVRETEAGRRLFPGFATEVEGGAAVRRPDDINTANISVLDHHGELLALWEGGLRACSTATPSHGSASRCGASPLRACPSPPTPRSSPTGRSGRSVSASLRSRRSCSTTSPRTAPSSRPSASTPGPLGIVHDFVVTERHLVIVIPPHVLDPERNVGTLLDAMVWRPDLGARVLVVEKDDFSAQRWYQLPAGFGFHHGNGWEDASGAIRFDLCVASDPTLMTETMRAVMRGELNRAAPERYTRFTLYPDGRTDIVTTGEEAEFPRIAPAVTGRRNRYVYTLGVSAHGRSGWRLRRVVKRDLEAETSEAFDYGPGVIAEEHVFVPRHAPRSEDDGWLVGPFLDYTRGLTGVGVFDARDVADGPLARAWLDYPLPLAFHGQFSPA